MSTLLKGIVGYTMWFKGFAESPQDIVNITWGQFVGMDVTGESLRL
jgi:hypothetical protein